MTSAPNSSAAHQWTLESLAAWAHNENAAPIDHLVRHALVSGQYRCHRCHGAQVYFYPCPGTYWCRDCDDIHRASFDRDDCQSCSDKGVAREAHKVQVVADARDVQVVAEGVAWEAAAAAKRENARRRGRPAPAVQSRYGRAEPVVAAEEEDMEVVNGAAAWQSARAQRKPPRSSAASCSAVAVTDCSVTGPRLCGLRQQGSNRNKPFHGQVAGSRCKMVKMGQRACGGHGEVEVQDMGGNVGNEARKV